MDYRWMGAILVFVGCGGFGFSLAAVSRREERMLRKLLQILEEMESELQYRLTPLPELCRMAGKGGGILHSVFLQLAQELDNQVAPDVPSCMHVSLAAIPDLPHSLRNVMIQLGNSLGKFDLPGQLRGIAGVRASCRRRLKQMEANRDVRLRSYQTLGLCTGAAMVILFI